MWGKNEQRQGRFGHSLKPRLFPTVTAGQSLREAGGAASYRVHTKKALRFEAPGGGSTARKPQSIASGRMSAGRSRAREGSATKRRKAVSKAARANRGAIAIIGALLRSPGGCPEGR